MTVVAKGTIVMVPHLPVLWLLPRPGGGAGNSLFFPGLSVLSFYIHPFILVPFNEI